MSDSACSHKDAGGGTGAAAAAPILVVVGMAREAACVEIDGVQAVVSGADPAQLRVALERLKDAPFSAVLSFGLCGGLAKHLRAGDVVVADAVVAGGARIAADQKLTLILSEGLAGAGRRLDVGAIVGVDEPVLDVPAKALMRVEAGAIAVDMESHVSAVFAASRGLPFAAIRVVSDPAHRALPKLVMQALDPDGGVAVGRVLRALAGDPTQLGDLARAGLDARAAFKTLGRCGGLLAPLFRIRFAGGG